MKKSSIMRKKVNLPPHSWESHPLTHHGAASKPFLIAMVTIVAVIILIILLFVSSPFVGKAFTGVVNTAGLEDRRVGVNLPFSATVKANLGASSSVGISFELDLKDGLTCADVRSIESLLGWNSDTLVLSTTRCASNKITFEYATLNWGNAKTGEFNVARINFNGLAAPGTYNLDFTSFNIISLENEAQDFIGEGLDAVITVAAASACTPAPEICDQLDNDCDGSVDEDNICTTLSITSLDFNNGEVLREEFTCGMNRNINGVSPRLTISNIPASANSLALIVEDLDIERTPQIPLVHWAVYDIPIPTTPTRMTTLEIPRGVTFSSAASAVAPALRGTPGSNEITPTVNQYAPPCPPAGATHNYRFRVYALTTPSINPAILTDTFIRSDEFADTIPRASLTGLYYPLPVSEAPRSGGGGFSCTSRWNCPSQWSYCNATLQQSRTCTDTNRCDTRKLTKLENRSCTVCEESWICTPWNNCQNGQQSRSCTDEHSCRTITQKPVLQKTCAVAETGPAPVRVQPSLPPPPQIQQPAPLPVPSFWDKYKWFILGIPSALLVIVLIIFGAVHLFKPKPTAYNAEELKEWVRKEQQMGTSNENIKTILAQHTGWNKEEVEKVVGESAEKNRA